MNPTELHLLIDALLEGDLSEADFLRLEAELSVDAAARRAYYDRVSLSVLLDAEASLPGASEQARPVLSAPKAERQWRRAFVGMAVAVMLLLAVLVSVLNPLGSRGRLPNPSQHAVSEAEPQASGFAVISGQTDAVWKEGHRLPDGALVPPGPLHLHSGLVQLELFSGVGVVIEGDAGFAVLSPMEMSVDHGKVRVHVPEPARGFRIHTSGGDVVDLGTEFALNVGGAHSEVHVLEGEVEWHSRARDMQRMESGDALRWYPDGRQISVPARVDEFIGAAQFRDQLRSSMKAKQQAWRAFSESMRRDPRLAAFYQAGAGEETSRQLPNLASSGTNMAGDGAIVAAVRTTDRWGQPAGALDFSPAGSRVRLTIPGEHASLTLYCWVKINSLDRWYNSLFLTDGHDLHEPHWQIMDDGRLFFSVKKRDQWDHTKGEKDKHIYLSPPFWNSSLSGQWLMIATVYDVAARRVTHYLNGEILSQEKIPEEYLVEQVAIGNASLGNWGLPIRKEPRFAIRNLNGSMDEFALFGAALSAREIKELYEHGRP